MVLEAEAMQSIGKAIDIRKARHAAFATLQISDRGIVRLCRSCDWVMVSTSAVLVLSLLVSLMLLVRMKVFTHSRFLPCPAVMDVLAVGRHETEETTRGEAGHHLSKGRLALARAMI